MITKKSWNEFRATGLFLFINSILHAFGWSLVVELDRDSMKVTNCYPARVKFRGFSEDAVEESYARIGKYIKENAEQLAEEAQ